jgi:hypothetical protein
VSEKTNYCRDFAAQLVWNWQRNRFLNEKEKRLEIRLVFKYKYDLNVRTFSNRTIVGRKKCTYFFQHY